MSDTGRPKSSGDKLDADEINADLPVVVTAGETLNGATLPVPVYMDDTDNEVKACDANDDTKLEFVGFVISNSTDGNDITLQKDGVVSGFSSLDIGKKYYVQDAAGTIGTTPGTEAVLVGIAISATQILIINTRNRVANGTRANFSQAVSTSENDSDLSTQSIGFRPRMIIISGYLFSNISGNVNVKGILHSNKDTGATGWQVDDDTGSGNFVDFTMGITSISATFDGGSFSLSIDNLTNDGFDIKLAWSTGATYSGTIQAQQISWIAIE